MFQSILKDLNILICRPEPSTTELSNALAAMGAQCTTFPCLAIETIPLSEAEKQYILDLDQYSHVIVTSQHAAEPALELIDAYWPQPPVEQAWHAIGRKTAEALVDDIPGLTEPAADRTSEELLASPALQAIEGQRVLLLKGEGGRNTIESALIARGASIDILNLYRRIRPAYSNEAIKNALGDFEKGYIITLSAETLLNLIHFADQIGVDLTSCHLIVPSERVARIALEKGFRLTYIPNNLKAIDMIRCISSVENQLKQ